MSESRQMRPDGWFDDENYAYDVQITRRTKWVEGTSGSEVQVSHSGSFSATVAAKTAKAISALLKRDQEEP